MAGPVLSSSGGVRFAEPIGWPLLPEVWCKRTY